MPEPDPVADIWQAIVIANLDRSPKVRLYADAVDHMLMDPGAAIVELVKSLVDEAQARR